jgi:hypothetical protein
MLKTIAGIALLLGSLGTMSCRPYVLTCKVPVLASHDQLAAVAWSKTYGECVEYVGPRVPVRYVYQAGVARVRIAAGDRYFPRLLFDAELTTGGVASIASAQVVEAHEGERPVPIELDGQHYRYFVQTDVLENMAPISIDILDGSGARVAQATFTYRLVTGYDLAIETL